MQSGFFLILSQTAKQFFHCSVEESSTTEDWNKRRIARSSAVLQHIVEQFILKSSFWQKILFYPFVNHRSLQNKMAFGEDIHFELASWKTIPQDIDFFFPLISRFFRSDHIFFHVYSVFKYSFHRELVTNIQNL